MKNKKLVDAIGKIDDTYVEEAHAKKQKKFVFSWAFVGKALTGVLCLVIVVSFVSNAFRMGSYKYESTAAVESAYDMETYNGVGAPMEAPAAEEEKGGGLLIDSNADVGVNKKLIVNGSMNIETTEFDDVMDSINTAIKEANGYVQSSSINQRGNDCRYYNATIRIPADKYADFIAKTKDATNVTFYSESVEDITDTYTDLEARLTSLKAEEAKVLDFYKQATNIEELLTVESRLTEIRYEIDSIETRLKNYDLLVSYSTLNISIEETKVYSKVDDSFFTRIKNAFVNGLNNFLEGVEDFVVDIIYNIWQILLIIVLIVIGVFVYKRIKNRKANK